eukprot:NODE_50_length_3774_cov_16.451275_g44_i0.p1 GENE.NODE_50_length_3774_cov_16.451275_g44_i0~~NODE_50_length_3774_cov_16.451275_g44_i0.p1  ORF type:complete len:1233 (-),score=249.86 NODE_50_length_3774_cov_16.451275_g44_i0:76-3237(-)
MGQTALHVAVNERKRESVRLLLKCEHIDTNVPDSRGFLPLTYASEEIAHMLLEHSSFNPRHRHYFPPYCMFVTENKHKVIEVLDHFFPGLRVHDLPEFDIGEDEEKGARKKVQFGSMLELKTAEAAILASKRKSLTDGGNIYRKNPKDSVPTIDLTEDQRKQLAAATITTDRGRTQLHLAIETGNEDVVQMLLQEGVDVNAADNADWTPLMLALLKCKDRLIGLKIAIKLLGNGASINQADNPRRWTALHFVVALGKHEELTFLKENGADFNAPDENLSTPLTIACRWARTACVKRLLVEKSVDIQATNRTGNTPLHEAVKSKKTDLEIARLLLTSTPQRPGTTVAQLLNARNSEGNTPLHDALSQGLQLPLHEKGSALAPISEEILQTMETITMLLLHAGADPDAQNRLGESPLHYAASRATHILALQLLVRSDSNIDIQTNDYSTPYIIAIQRNNDEGRDYLAQCGADMFVPRPEDAPTTKLSLRDYRYLPLFVIYMLLHGIVLYPIEIFYQNIIGTRLTKILNYGISNYDNELRKDGPSKWLHRIALLISIGILIGIVALPWAIVSMAEAGYHNEAVGLYLTMLFSVQLFALIKASQDRLFFAVNHPVEQFRVRPQRFERKSIQAKMAASSAVAIALAYVIYVRDQVQPTQADRVTLSAKKKKKNPGAGYKFANIPPLLSIFVDFFTLCSFAFQTTDDTVAVETVIDAGSSSGGSSGEEFILKQFWDRFLLDFGQDTFTLSYWAVIGVCIFWFFLYSFVVATRDLLRKSWREKWFPFIHDYKLAASSIDILVGLLAGSGYSIISKTFFEILDCTDGLLDANLMVCWDPRHTRMATIGMIVGYFYILSATTITLSFREPRTPGARDIQYIGFFLLLETFLKTVISSMSVMLNRWPSYIFRGNALSYLLLLVATIVLDPCRNIRSINYLRTAVYSCAVVSIFVSFMWHNFPREVTQADAFVAWFVVSLVVYLVYKRIPVRDSIQGLNAKFPRRPKALAKGEPLPIPDAIQIVTSKPGSAATHPRPRTPPLVRDADGKQAALPGQVELAWKET